MTALDDITWLLDAKLAEHKRISHLNLNISIFLYWKLCWKSEMGIENSESQRENNEC